MIELRWYVEGEKQTLQYRQQYDATIRAGMWVDERPANLQWSDWKEVPVVTAPRVGEINALTVDRLRSETDATMMECKKALTACNGDFEKAKEWLRNGYRFRTYV